ncbi:MAG: hypothetical protein K8I29_06705 [Alphaproteobacteria bacterium]|uniref:Uncharacterized protein n=1 Tax=Candidatus Nitrobium versatile TaxID=2884831 RepID=A0A953JC30_9BACT|nr:hypothetical protein [Candidatus Nitrobium versatile]
MIYDINTGSKTCVKQTAIKAGFPWILDLDEDGDKETMLFTLETGYRTIEVYQKQTDGSWLLTKRIQAQAQAPERFISSPEPFKGGDGKWYVVYATTSLTPLEFYKEENTEATGSIWIATLFDDSAPERITPDSSISPAKRSEPEALTLPNGKTAIYYTYSFYDEELVEYTELSTLKMARIVFSVP